MPDAIEPNDARERFESLYDLHHRSVLAYALRRSSTPEDAGDVVSETFLVAWRKLDSVPEGDAARWWLYRTASFSLANTKRSEIRRDSLASELSTALAAARPEPAPDETSAAITSALASLSDEDREILTLHAWEELGARELAAVLDLNRATARTRLHRARKRLRSALEAGEGNFSALVPQEELS